MARKKTTRRDFLRKTAVSTAAASLAPSVIGAKPSPSVEMLKANPAPPRVSPNDTIRIATFGMGIIGFIDTDTALRVPGTELVAVADCYDGRLQRAKEVYGAHVETTRDYREILARSDIDAVLVCTPDHWHTQMAIDAMEAGKAVYCEKPMVHKLEEGLRLIEAEQRTGQVLQVGSQGASSILYHKAQELIDSGAIGEVNMIEASTNRNSAIGAWQYSLPPDASTETIDWDGFLGNAPKRDFDPIRFFRWRNYWDYGTGVAGDLYVHLFTAIHLVVRSLGPTQIVAMGGLRFWKDGRDAPDVHLGLFDYPETDTHPSFTLSLQSNFAHGGGGGSHFRFIGSEGSLNARGGTLTLSRAPRRRPSVDSIVRGYNSVRTFSEATQKEFEAAYQAAHPTPEDPDMNVEQTFQTPPGYDSRYDHFVNLFTAMRNNSSVLEDAAYGFRAAAPSLMSNLSYVDNTIYQWDPQSMRLRT